jgi:pimeloyl-ACP methyl ester carboxylesterase
VTYDEAVDLASAPARVPAARQTTVESVNRDTLTPPRADGKRAIRAGGVCQLDLAAPLIAAGGPDVSPHPQQPAWRRAPLRPRLREVKRRQKRRDILCCIAASSCPGVPSSLRPAHRRRRQLYELIRETDMNDQTSKLVRSQEIASKVGQLLSHRAKAAQARFAERLKTVAEEQMAKAAASPVMPWDLWRDGQGYAIDLAQRSILFWDTLRQRGNNYLAHERAGLPPVLHFEYETILDGRTFERPVNYALLRILPPEGVRVDEQRRPYIIIDPRAGHGPGIGGFKDDSQVGVALRDGHPVYFVVFHRDPEPGQTLLDVCTAEARFVHAVRGRHPNSPKPVLVGNCQGGWAAMMLAAANPDDTGPIVINGAPMSYWGGAWSEGEGDNPMRYAGGLLGGTWMSSLAADIGNGVFDGAHLVQNFENLNPANTFWGKYYHLFANVDSEAPRFLEFERWWGGFYLMNREEIEWITQNLFVGNKLWSGSVQSAPHSVFDLRAIKAPIVLFASLGDNITPPQQAFNWVADVYGSTDEIKARGQVIVGLMHEDVGHLGIFVSGKVAKKEHAQIVSVMKSIEALPPGLYGMNILDAKGPHGEPVYDVEFVEHRLEDVAKRLNRLQRADEKAFEAVAGISEFNQRAYELFAQPLVQASATELGAKLSRESHPLRAQRYAVSDANPWLWWLGPLAEAVRAQRQSASPDQLWRRTERMGSELIGASLDYYRDLRDAASEAAFFLLYGNLFSLYLADRETAPVSARAAAGDPRTLPYVAEALASIDQGGYAEAVARVAALLALRGQALPLSRVQLRHDLAEEYKDLLPDISWDLARRIRGEQDIIVRYEPEQALATLPTLLSNAADRQRLLALLERLIDDPRVQALSHTPEQAAMLARIRGVLAERPSQGPRLAASRGA